MVRKKVVITGSNGLLGQKLVKLFLTKPGYQVFALSRGENRMLSATGYTYCNIDLLDTVRLRECIMEIGPHALIHTAAMTNVDACEQQQEECRRLNVDLVREIAALCRETGTHLVHLSTDFIFNGEKGSVYVEQDAPDPVNFYGITKWQSEEVVRNSGARYTIMRTILVYGNVDRRDRGNIVLWVKHSLEQGKDINVVTDQLRMPTLAEDLAEACWLAVSKPAYGVYHVSSCELMSIYEIALAVADAYGLDKSRIHPVGTDDLHLPAKRPASTGFDLSRSISDLGLPVYTFRERLQVYRDQYDG